MKHIYLLCLTALLTLQATAQRLEWSRLFDIHSRAAQSGIAPTSVAAPGGRITTTVVERDTLYLYQAEADGTISATLSTEEFCGDFTRLIRMENGGLAIVYHHLRGGTEKFFRLLLTDADLNIVRKVYLQFSEAVPFVQLLSLFELGNRLFVSFFGNREHYLFSIDPDSGVLSQVHRGSVPLAYGEDHQLLSENRIVFGFQYGYDSAQIIRCISPLTGTVAWERDIRTGHGIPLRYKIASDNNGHVYITAHERAWVDGKPRDILNMLRIDAATGGVLGQSVFELPEGCLYNLQDLVYNTANDRLYLCHGQCSPVHPVAVVMMDTAFGVLQRGEFALVHDQFNIGEEAKLHIRPDGQMVLLYSSYKDDTEKGNLYISLLDTALSITGTLDIHFAERQSSESFTDVLSYDDDRILVTGIVPHPDPFISGEEVRYFTAMVNLAQVSSAGRDTASLQRPQLYPNPAADQVTIGLPGHQDYELTVFDLSGQVVIRPGIPVRDRYTLDTNGLLTGLYIIHLAGPEGMHTVLLSVLR